MVGIHWLLLLLSITVAATREPTTTLLIPQEVPKKLQVLLCVAKLYHRLRDGYG